MDFNTNGCVLQVCGFSDAEADPAAQGRFPDNSSIRGKIHVETRDEQGHPVSSGRTFVSENIQPAVFLGGLLCSRMPLVWQRKNLLNLGMRFSFTQ